MAYGEVNIEELSVGKSLDLNTLTAILDNVYKGTIVVDVEGRIVFMSRSNEKYYNLKPGEAIGKHVTQILKSSRLHIVARTGIPEIGHIVEVKEGEYRVVERIPIKKGGKPIGAIAKIMFGDFEKAKVLSDRIRHLEGELSTFREQLHDLFSAKYTFDKILGASLAIKEVKETALRSAQTSSTVLILGESGTGKELFAHSIHNASPRRAFPFVRVNCASIPPELFEAEFFGYEKGAFTGANPKGRKGQFQLANRGTIFLDEISEMPVTMQAKLLRVLQEKEVSKVGSDRLVKLDFRLIASSNKNLEKMVASGDFRDDLYYRLNVITLVLPPLRDRIQDLEMLAVRFIDDLNRDLGTKISGLSDEAWVYLQNHTWKGNVRELRNVLERAMTVCQEKALDARHLSSHLSKKEVCITVLAGKSLLLSENLRAAERDTILRALKEAKGNKRKACRILGISRSGLYEKMSSYGLNTNSWKAAVQDGENLSSLDREEIECGTESFDAAN
jgi:transcriptional regulator with PAS, ATPase and Fis domain